MKRSAFYFHILLFAILAVFLVLGIFVDDEFYINLAIAWAIFGFIQLMHSLIIASIFWTSLPGIRPYFRVYWIGAAIDLFFVFFVQDISFDGSGLWVFIIFLPLILAVLLLFITWNFRSRPVVMPDETKT